MHQFCEPLPTIKLSKFSIVLLDIRNCQLLGGLRLERGGFRDILHEIGGQAVELCGGEDGREIQVLGLLNPSGCRGLSRRKRKRVIEVAQIL